MDRVRPARRSGRVTEEDVPLPFEPPVEPAMATLPPPTCELIAEDGKLIEERWTALPEPPVSWS